jgi:nicotinamidase-related amidase
MYTFIDEENAMNVDSLLSTSRPFLEWAVDWHSKLGPVPLGRVIADPDRTAVLAIDVLNGFCYQGPLSSERVAGIVGPIVNLFKAAHARGVRHFLLPEENHPPDAVEFASYGPHCVAGTAEAETVRELAGLPFSDQFVRIGKNSISPFVRTGLEDWLRAHPEVSTFIVVGDCTDLCTYQLAMGLRLRANAHQLDDVRVVLPVDGVQTYNLPVDVARQIGAVPHDGDLLHLVFLYHLMLNGVEVVASIAG